MPFSTSFVLESERLRLRMPSQEDIPHVFSASRYPGFTDGMLWEPPEREAELLEPLQRSIRAWETNKAFPFTIEDKDSRVFLGRISIRPTEETGRWNIGFWTHPEQQGRGIMTEAVKAVIHFGFEHLQATAIEACYALWNKASERVLQKSGMRFVRYIPEGFEKHGAWVEENLLEIRREDWA